MIHNGCSRMPRKIYSLYHNIEDFTFSMPGGWDDYTISVFLEACHKYVDDLRVFNGNFMQQWSRIVGYGLAKTSNLNCFNITVTMELAKVLKAYLLKNENTQQYVTNETFRNLLDDTKDLLEYFPNANESQIETVNHSKKCNCSPPTETSKPMSVLNVIKSVTKQYRHLFGAKGIPASILWSEISQKVTEKTGAKIDVKQFLEPIKIEIALKVRKENDIEMKSKKFLALAKDYLTYFDYIPPRSIKKTDFLPTELMDEIVEDDCEVYKNDSGTTEETKHITANINEDFVDMDVDFVGAYCEVPYNEEAKSNHSRSPKCDEPNHSPSCSEENMDDVFLGLVPSPNMGFESVRVEKCETELCKNSNILVNEVPPTNSNPEDGRSQLMKSFNNFDDSFDLERNDRRGILSKNFHNSDHFIHSGSYYRLTEDDPMFGGGSINQESYSPSTVINKYPTTESDYVCCSIKHNGTTNDTNKSNRLSKYVNGCLEQSGKHNATSHIGEVSSEQSLSLDNTWDGNIRINNNSCKEIKGSLIERIAENFNLQYDQAQNKSKNNELLLRKTICNQIDVNTSSCTELEKSNDLCNLYESSNKFNENLLRDTTEVFDLNSAVTDVYSSPTSADKMGYSLESLIATSRNSSPLSVSESVENLMLDDISSTGICDEGLFKRTMPDIRETCISVEVHQVVPIENYLSIKNMETINTEKYQNNKSPTTNNSHSYVHKHRLKRSKSMDNVLRESRTDSANENANNKWIAFLKELREMLLDKKLNENVRSPDENSEVFEKNCENVDKAKEYDETKSEINELNSTEQTSPPKLSDKNGDSNPEVTDEFTGNTTRISDFSNKEKKSDKLNSLQPETSLEQNSSEIEPQHSLGTNIELSVELSTSENKSQNTEEIPEEKLVQHSDSENEAENLNKFSYTNKKMVNSSKRKHMLRKQEKMTRSLLLRKKVSLHKKKIKLMNRRILQRQRCNKGQPLTIELDNVKGINNLRDSFASDKESTENSTDSLISQKSCQENQFSNKVLEKPNEIGLNNFNENLILNQKRIWQEDSSNSDDSDTPFYGFRSCNPTRRFKKRRKVKPLDFSRSDNFGPVLVNNKVVLLKKAVVLVKDFIKDVTLSLETDPKLHVCLCNCAKVKEQVYQKYLKSSNSTAITSSFERKSSTMQVNEERLRESNETNENKTAVPNQTETTNSVEINYNSPNQSSNSSKESQLRNSLCNPLEECMKQLRLYIMDELSSSKIIREVMENEKLSEISFDSVFDSIEFIFSSQPKSFSWINKFVTEYRNHLTWKTQIKWKMEKEVQAVEKNKALILEKLLKLLPKLSVE
ncbi:uncharacterized protein [Rhodnius prolixus]|uniref:uncharacterized protein n=1 Tax=Rhodnius prolixus TaxID=13249 RepID=UPI003D18D59F